MRGGSSQTDPIRGASSVSDRSAMPVPWGAGSVELRGADELVAEPMAASGHGGSKRSFQARGVRSFRLTPGDAQQESRK